MKPITTIGILLFAITASAQDVLNYSSFGSLEYSEVVDFESGIGSKFKVSTYFNPHGSDYFQDIDLDVTSQAHIFSRADNNFSPGLATWYFLNKDSIVKGYYYNWGFYNPDFNPTKNHELLKEQDRRLKDYRQQYEIVKANLIELLGENYNEVLVSNAKKKYYEYCTWDMKEQRTVLEIVFDPSLTEIQGFVAGGDSHISIKTFIK